VPKAEIAASVPGMPRIPLLLTLIVAGVYVAAAEGSRHLLSVSGDAPMVWFASGVGLVALLLAGWRALAGVWLGALVCALLGEHPPVVAALSSVAITGQIALAWWLLRRAIGSASGIDRVHDMFALVILGATVVPLISAARAFANIWWNPGIATDERIGLILVSSLGEAIGILLLAPTAIAWAQHFRSTRPSWPTRESWLLYGLTLIVSAIVFSGWLAPTMSAETLPYALFPLSFWAALRLGVRDTATVFLVAGAIAISCHAMGMGPFVMPSIAPGHTFAQFGSLYLFLAVLGITSLLAAAAQHERVGAEVQVRESEQRYRMLIERMNEGVNITDADARMVFVSDRFCEMTGYTREELLGRTGAMLTAPEQLAAWEGSHRVRQAGRAESHALTLLRKDGQLLHVWISPKPQFDAAGAYLGSLNVVLDVTDRRRAEDQARGHLDQLAHVARVASMGEMASAIAHEINQPLTAIANYANASLRLLKSGQMSTDELADTMRRLASEAERAGMVVRKMRGFVRGEEARPEPIAIGELFADVLELTRAEARQYDAEVHARADRALPEVQADAIQIEQVLINLVRNACEAMAAAGSAERRITLSAWHKDEGMVEIAVHDTGPGLTAAQVEKVFEPFYTTKPEGIGIGLALSRSIIDAHGGRLWVVQDGPGAVFKLTLPIARATENA